MLNNAFTPEAIREAVDIFLTEFPLAIWETLYVTILATFFAIVLGLPLGVLLVIGEKDGVLPLPTWFMQTLNVVINLLRSVPFLIPLDPCHRGYGGGNRCIHRSAGDCCVPLCGSVGGGKPS